MFRDDYERQAHDIICIVKYGATGGKVSTNDMRRVGDILRGHTLDPPKPRIVIPPRVNIAPPTAPKVVMPNLVVTKPAVTIPTITMPKPP